MHFFFHAAWNYRDDLLAELAAEFPFITIKADLDREYEWEVEFHGHFEHGKLKEPWRMNRAVICASREDIDFPNRDRPVGSIVKVRSVLTARREVAEILEVQGADFTLRPVAAPENWSFEALRVNGAPGDPPRWPRNYREIQHGRYGDAESLDCKDVFILNDLEDQDIDDIVS